MFKKPKRIPQKISSRTEEDNDESNHVTRQDEEEDDHVGERHQVKRFRIRTASEDESDDSDNQKDPTSSSNLLHQVRKEQQEQGIHTKKARTLISTTTSTTTSNPSSQGLMHQYSSVDVSHVLTQKDFATRTAEYHSQEKKDTIATNIPPSSSTENVGTIYKGNQEPRNKFLAGPIRASTTIRTTCRFDYQPDICKDYKETGFCGFGDTCIYLHDRGDTKTGWQIEAEWEEKRKRDMERKEKEMDQFLTRFQEKAKQGELDEEEGGDGDDDWNTNKDPIKDDGLPFACFLCRGAFQEPIVTSCGHYFCQRCILKNVQEKSTTACPICSKDTNGVFNHPMKLVAKKRRVVGVHGTWEEFEREMKRGK